MKYWGIFFLLPTLLLAQPEFFGYFESEADVMQLGSISYKFGYNKFRLDVEARPSDNVLIGANLNVEKYWGKTSWNIYDFLPGYSDSGLELIEEIRDTILVDNLYMRISFPWADLTVGRQQLSPGVGYAWNPTDIFNTKSLLDPSYEQTGVPAIRLDLPLDSRSSLSIALKPESNWDNSTRQVWLRGGAGHFDFEVTVAQHRWQSVRSLAYGYTELDKKLLIGGSVVGEILGCGIWVEYGYNKIDYSGGIPIWAALLIPPVSNINSYSEVVLGADHTFDNSLYVLTEFLHNGYRPDQISQLSIADYFASLGGQTHSLMQDYAFFYAMHPTFDYITLSSLVIANFNDNSGTLAPQLDWNAFEDTNISLQGSLFWGEENAEFGLQDWGLRLRVRSDF